MQTKPALLRGQRSQLLQIFTSGSGSWCLTWLCTLMGTPPKKFSVRFFNPFRVGGVVQTFYSNRPCKGVSKTGFKIFWAPKNCRGHQSSPNFVIFRLFRPFLHNGASCYHQSENGLSTTDTSLWDGETIMYFGPLWNTWLRLICTRPVGGGIPTQRSSVELIF